MDSAISLVIWDEEGKVPGVSNLFMFFEKDTAQARATFTTGTEALEAWAGSIEDIDSYQVEDSGREIKVVDIYLRDVKRVENGMH